MFQNLDSMPVYLVSIGETDTDLFSPKYHLAHHVLLGHRISQVLSRIIMNLYRCKGSGITDPPKSLKRMSCDNSNMVCDLTLNRILLEHDAYIRVSYPPDEDIDTSFRDWRFTVMCSKINPELLRLISASINMKSTNTKGYKPEVEQPTLRGDSCVPLSKERWFRYIGLSKRVAYVQVFNHLSELNEEGIGPRQILKSNIEPMRFLTLIQVCIALRLDISIVDGNNHVYPIIFNKTKKAV